MADTVEIEFEYEGLTYTAVVEVTSWGSPPHMGSLTYPGDPGDPIEWATESYWQEHDGKEAAQVYDGVEPPAAFTAAAKKAIEEMLPDLNPADNDPTDWLI